MLSWGLSLDDRQIGNGLHSIAFPAISCGVYGYPIDEAAAIAVRTVREELLQNRALDRVIFAAFGEDVHHAIATALAR